MTLFAAVTLFVSMVALAALPSISVVAVVSRTATSGFAHGACVALGVVIGDLIFILLALFGLVVLIASLGELFFLIKLLGAGYLIWLAVRCWRSSMRPAHYQTPASASLFSDFMTGLLITLADQKALLFYLGFLPVFLDLKRLSYFDTGLVMLIALVAVGGVKLGYAWVAADAGKHLAGSRYAAIVNLLAIAVMVVAATWLAVSAGLEFTVWLR